MVTILVRLQPRNIQTKFETSPCNSLREIRKYVMIYCDIQWNPSCEATPFASEMWPFKRGGLSSGVEINTFMLRFTLSSGLSRGVASYQGGLSKVVQLHNN